MLIKSEKAKITQYCGNDDLDAEVKIVDDGEIVYIHAHYGYDGECFSASYKSIFDEMEKDEADMDFTFEYIEDFEEFEETKNSKYAKYYAIAERMIDDIADSYKG